MEVLRRVWELAKGPTLFKKYEDGDIECVYEPQKLEKWGDRGITLMKIVWNLGLYTSPITATIMYRRGYVVWESLVFLSNVIFKLGLVVSASSYPMRGIGRYMNPAYVEFFNTLQAAQKDVGISDVKKKLMKYDFDFWAWPVEYKVERKGGRVQTSSERPSPRKSALASVVSVPCRLVSYIAANFLALKLVYPGSVKTLQYFLFLPMLQGRTKLVEEFKAERFKVRTRDENDIDVIFVDRRNEVINRNGRTLVVCCEGNCGFYEVGCMMTAIEAKYSVVGWNHPGFGGSTGAPFPSQEQNAIDAVMQFAIDSLGFRPDQILLYGWSIGGYTSSWAAMNYPDVKGLILDATFDDLLPLALARMPSFLEPLIRRIIREHINLTVFENVAKFPGPVTFIRRSEDEMICTEDGNPSTNRGNHLVAKFLKCRYPKIIDEKRQILLEDWLTSDALHQNMLRDKHFVDKDFCTSALVSYIEDNSASYPMLIGDGLSEEQKYQLTLFLAEKYMKEYRSSHCTPLPVNMFRQPWAPAVSEAGFVKL